MHLDYIVRNVGLAGVMMISYLHGSLMLFMYEVRRIAETAIPYKVASYHNLPGSMLFTKLVASHY